MVTVADRVTGPCGSSHSQAPSLLPGRCPHSAAPAPAPPDAGKLWKLLEFSERVEQLLQVVSPPEVAYQNGCSANEVRKLVADTMQVSGWSGWSRGCHMCVVTCVLRVCCVVAVCCKEVSHTGAAR